MAAPRKTLVGLLPCAAAQPCFRAAAPRHSAAALVLLTRTSGLPAWRSATTATATATATPRTLTGHRCYSSQAPQSRVYSFNDVVDQLKINDSLAKSGKEVTEDGRSKVIFVDVREPGELLETGRIPGAINIPIYSAAQSYHLSDEDFADMHGFDRPPKDAPLVFYCKAGVRAKSAAALAHNAGWTNVGEYPGSWLDWQQHDGDREVKATSGSKWDRVTKG